MYLYSHGFGLKQVFFRIVVALFVHFWEGQNKIIFCFKDGGLVDGRVKTRKSIRNVLQ